MEDKQLSPAESELTGLRVNEAAYVQSIARLTANPATAPKTLKIEQRALQQIQDRIKELTAASSEVPAAE